MKKIVILISGRGSNMECLIQACREQGWDAQIAAVIANRPDAAGLEIAQSHQIPVQVVTSKGFETREAFEAELSKVIDCYAPDLVVLAGFMRILTAPFVEHYLGRMVNIHPSLLPSFPGLATHQKALTEGVKVHGATVHYVTPELDHGPIIMQGVVPVLPQDNEQSLAERVLAMEHRIYPAALQAILQGQVWFETNKAGHAPAFKACLGLESS